MYKAICVGLVFTCVSFGAVAQSASRSALDELRVLPKPRGQSDLDTTRIVSVDRAMAASTEERTSGLWQSWRVAVCQGCGVADQRTVAEINMATAAYVRPGDKELLSRSRTPQSSELNEPPLSRDRSAPRMLVSELLASQQKLTAWSP